MPNIDWGLIVETIRAERCVLFLGPGMMRTKANKSFWTEMVEELKLGDAEGIEYFDQDKLFMYKDPIQRTRTYFKIKAFYREQTERIQPELFEKLARIKFNLVVSISPDHYLSDLMKTMELPHKYDFYNKTVNPAPIDPPKSDEPLIYNLFGSVEEEQSLILTHNDLYNFLFSILGDHKLPDQLQNSLQNAANYIFLGFNFEKWYMQLLLRLLNLHDEKYSFDRYASNMVLADQAKTFYQQQFRINFVDEDLDGFVNTLFTKCQEGGVIREEDESSDLPLAERVEKLLVEERFEDAMGMMNVFFEQKGEEDLASDILLLQSRYKRLQRKITQEVINAEDANVESQKINKALLEINKEVKELQTA